MSGTSDHTENVIEPKLRLSDDRGTVILTMNISSSRSSMPAERITSGTSDHTENVIEPQFLCVIYF